MKRHARRKPKVKGRFAHAYRVVVEKTVHQSIVIKAPSQDDAESRAYDFAERHPENWVDGECELRDCTSVLMTDGTWKFCDALDTDSGDMVQYTSGNPSRAEKETK